MEQTNMIRQVLDTMHQYGSEDHKQFVKQVFARYKQLEASKNGKYAQIWPLYNQAQAKEKVALMHILDELLNYIPFPDIEKKGVGRNPISIRDKIFYLVLQCYNIKSSRRCIGDIEIARRLNLVSKVPHFNSVLKSLRDSSLISLLKHLVQVSGIPLQHVEEQFAVDSSGFSTTQYGRWFDVRNGRNSDKRKFVKAHLMCGTRTNVITSVNITKGYAADSPEFESLVRSTTRIYRPKEISADKAYLSRKNLQITADAGAIPFIPFKKNSVGTARGSSLWRKMYQFFTEYSDQFYHHYHRRSNSETCFHMLKRKFGSSLRSRSEIGQINEVLVKCLVHNLCVLIQEALELGIDLNFKKCAEMEIEYN